MRTVLYLCFFSIWSLALVGQRAMCIDPAFEVEVEHYLTESVPYISVADAHNDVEGYTFLDAREKEEYDVSHIPGAVHVGYDHFDIKSMEEVDKNEPIVIYCSIGYRSEKIGEKLKAAGYKQVYNLYGSIFEWVNQHNEVEDNDGNPVKAIHTYNKAWSKWLTNPAFTKVY